MSAAKKIKMMLASREMTQTELANQLNKSKSAISDKMKRDNFSEKDLQEIARVLNYAYEVVFTDKETGKTI